MLPVWDIPRPSLAMADSVAAIIKTPDKKFLMQFRDAKPNIWYPASWGCFGGAIDKGESCLQALRRELFEELELRLADCEMVSRFEFDLRPVGLESYFREYYLIKPTESELSDMVLHEGERLAAFSFEELANVQLTPYDAFAIHLYWMRKGGMLAARFSP